MIIFSKSSPGNKTEKLWSWVLALESARERERYECEHGGRRFCVEEDRVDEIRCFSLYISISALWLSEIIYISETCIIVTFRLSLLFCAADARNDSHERAVVDVSLSDPLFLCLNSTHQKSILVFVFLDSRMRTRSSLPTDAACISCSARTWSGRRG